MDKIITDTQQHIYNCNYKNKIKVKEELNLYKQHVCVCNHKSLL
jgi:hypothetical protein